MKNTAEMSVFLVPYDPTWPKQFNDEATLIKSLFEPGSITIEHIGSTAISGISAKPIIDIMALIDSIDTAKQFMDRLEKLHYHYHPYGEDIFPERRWHCKPDPLNRTHHLHLVERGSRFHFDHLLFRDYLRVNRQDALSYEQLKFTLAKQFPNDREAYTDCKSEFVKSILEVARGAADIS